MFNWWNSIDTVSSLNAIFQWLILVVSVLVLVFSSRLSTLQDRDIANNKQILEQRITQAKVATDLLNEKLKPRLISQEQRNQFSELSKDIPKGFVIITTITANSESLNFGSQLADMLKDNGYTVEIKQILFIDSVPSGIKMSKGLESKADLYTIPLKHCMDNIGFNVEIIDSVDKEKQFPELLIGQKE